MPVITTIDDVADPRIEAYRDIRERDLVGRQGCFVAEGRVVIEKVVASAGFRLDSMLVAAHRLESLADVLDKLDTRTPVFAASQAVVDAIAGFALHRGLLAIGRREDAPSADALLGSLPTRSDILVLSGIANHDNMGGIFRNAAAFGTRAVILDARCCDPLYRKAIRVSVGATLLVPFAKVDRGADLLGLLDRHGFSTVGLSPRGEHELQHMPVADRNAVLLGAEGPGLSPDVMSRARTVRLAMAGGFDSLNVATTSGIVLHHLFAASR